MIYYLLLIVFCTFFGFLSNKVNHKQKKTLIFFSFLFLFIISAIRYNVGKDYLSYANFFENIHYGNNSNYEVGFYIFNRILRLITDNSQIIFFTTSFIINYFAVKIIKNNNNSPLSYFIYLCGTFYFFGMNGIRQTISIMLFYHSLKFIKEKNFKQYIFYNILGTLFHSSSWLFIVLYFFLYRDLSRTKKFLIILFSIFFSNFIINILFSALEETKYYIYISKASYYTASTINISSIINIIIFILYEFRCDKSKKENIIFGNVHYLGIIVSILMPYLPLANRLFVCFRYIEFISVPNLIRELSKDNPKKKMIISLIVYILYFIYFIHGVYIENGNTVLPYKTFFTKQ